MTRVVWLNDGFVEPERAVFSIDDPGARFGEGLRETMRSDDGVVPWLDRHMDRLRRSAAELRLEIPAIDAVSDAIDRVAAALGHGLGRISAMVTPHPTIVVEGSPTQIDPEAVLTAVSIQGAWHPGNRLAEHKTLSFLPWRDAVRRAQRGDADTALLLDQDGNLGEAALANAFCVVDGRILTAPVDGILAGVTREVVLERCRVEETIIPPDVWRHCDEMFLTSAVSHVVPLVAVDDRPFGDGRIGPVTARVRQEVARG